MADRTARDTARDTVRDVAFERFLEWDDSHTLADAVLAALGIDPDTPTDDVRAGLAAMRLLPWWEMAVERSSKGGHVAWADQPHSSGPKSGYGETPAAAVLALTARLEEPGA